MSKIQTSLDSGFGFNSTAEDVISGIDLTGKIAIITGGYSGIGKETARALAQAGATIIIPAHNIDKAREVIGSIPHAELANIDLLDTDSIDSFADDFIKSGRPLHLLINNAGIMAAPLSRDSRGIESQLSANHIGHFHLTRRLWPALQRAQGARVVGLTSGAHRRAAFDFEDPNFNTRAYDRWTAYAQAKTAVALFALELDNRGATHGIRAFSAHPGRIETGLQRHLSIWDLQALGYRDDSGEIPQEQLHMYKTIEQGAATTVWCATSPRLNNAGGAYCENCDIAVEVNEGFNGLTGVLPWATDPALAQRLWSLSEDLLNITPRK